MTELETLEGIRGDVGMREVILRMARLSRRGRLELFVAHVACDPGVGSETRAWIGALAANEPCLHAVEAYLVE